MTLDFSSFESNVFRCEESRKPEHAVTAPPPPLPFPRLSRLSNNRTSLTVARISETCSSVNNMCGCLLVTGGGQRRRGKGGCLLRLPLCWRPCLRLAVDTAPSPLHTCPRSLDGDLGRLLHTNAAPRFEYRPLTKRRRGMAQPQRSSSAAGWSAQPHAADVAAFRSDLFLDLAGGAPSPFALPPRATAASPHHQQQQQPLAPHSDAARACGRPGLSSRAGAAEAS